MTDRKKGVAKQPSVTFKLQGNQREVLDKMATDSSVRRHEVGQLALQLGLQTLAEYPGGVNGLREDRARAESLEKIFGGDLARRLERIAKDQDLNSLEVARIALGLGCDHLENRGVK